MRRRIRNRSDSVSEQEDPEAVATYRASIDAVNLNVAPTNTTTSADLFSTQVSAPAPSLPTNPTPVAMATITNTKESPRGLFSRISLKHKRRSTTAPSRRAPLGRVLNN